MGGVHTSMCVDVRERQREGEGEGEGKRERERLCESKALIGSFVQY